MKGYIISLSAILLLSSMLLFAVFYSENIKERNLNAGEIKKYSKLNFVKDDLSYDLNRILGTGITVERNDVLAVLFTEKIPAGFDKKERIKKLKEFIENSYSSVNNAKIAFNTERIQNSIPVKFSNDLVYEYDFEGKFILFYAVNKDTNMFTADINITSKGNATGVTEKLFTANPNLTINFNYSDQNASNEKHEILNISSRSDNVILISFSGNADDVIEIHLGRFEGKRNAVKVWNRTLNETEMLLEFRPVMQGLSTGIPFRAFIDADLNYSQADLNSDSLTELTQLS